MGQVLPLDLLFIKFVAELQSELAPMATFAVYL